jgi:competence protein ComEA
MPAPAADPLGTPDDVLARLRLRGRLTENEACRVRAGGGAHGRPRLRARVSRWAVAGIGAALLAVGAAFAVPALVAGTAGASGVSPAPVSWAEGAAEQDPAAPPAGEGLDGAGPEAVVVYVTGAVAAPGVFELGAGSRVVDAIGQAGGALPDADLTVLNLAAVLADGERVYVPLPGETPPPVLGADGGPAAAAASGAGAVNVNTASAEQLTALPGIGPVLAERIVAFRAANGPFAALGDLGEVSGIGPKVLAGLADMVAF